MPSWKVAYFSGVGGRPQVMLAQAPDDLEITVVDPALSEAEKIELCRDADAIITRASRPMCSRNAPTLD